MENSAPSVAAPSLRHYLDPRRPCWAVSDAAEPFVQAHAMNLLKRDRAGHDMVFCLDMIDLRIDVGT